MFDSVGATINRLKTCEAPDTQAGKNQRWSNDVSEYL